MYKISRDRRIILEVVRYEVKPRFRTQTKRFARWIWNFNIVLLYNRTSLPEAYERLLLETIQGDASLFTRSDGIESCWRVIDPVLEGWAHENRSRLVTYERGTWGPAEALNLLARSAHIWRLGCME